VKIVPHSCPAIDAVDYQGLKNLFEKEYVGSDNNLDEELKICIREFVDSSEINITPSGSMALVLALFFSDIQKGDEVIMSAINCWTVYNAIIFLGGIPVICDVREIDDFRASTETIKEKISQKTKAIIVTHMYGELIDAKHIQYLADEHNIKIIEDYSTSFGVVYRNGDKIGKYSDFAIGSFGSTKPITGGIGGFIASNQKHKLNNYGLSNAPLLNMNISSLNQKLLMMQFPKLKEIRYAKKKLIQFYSDYSDMWGNLDSGMFRYLTFSDISVLIDFLAGYNIEIDARDSVQPNIAIDLGLQLQNASNFKKYHSIPFHLKAYTSFKSMGIL